MSDDDTHSLEIRADSDQSLSLVQSILDGIELEGSITAVSVTLESTEPFEHVAVSADDLVGVGPVQSETESDEANTESESQDPESDESLDGVVSFVDGSDAQVIADVLAERRDEGFLNLEEIQQFTPNEAGIPDGNFSSVLWDLANRGLVEKKPHPDDGRKKVYRLTDTGVKSVESE